MCGGSEGLGRQARSPLPTRPARRGSAPACGFSGASRSGLRCSPHSHPPAADCRCGPQPPQGGERGLGRQRPRLSPQRPGGERPACGLGGPASASWAGNVHGDPNGPTRQDRRGAWGPGPGQQVPQGLCPAQPTRPRGRASTHVSAWPLGSHRPGPGRGPGPGRPAAGSGSVNICGVRLARRLGVRAEGSVGCVMTPFAETRARQSPRWARAPVPQPEPAPGHTEAWAPRHARDPAKARDPGASPPDSPPGRVEMEAMGGAVTATTDAPGRPLTGPAGSHTRSRRGAGCTVCPSPAWPPAPPPPLRHFIRPGVCVLEKRKPPWTPKSAPYPRTLQAPRGPGCQWGPLMGWERFEPLRKAEEKGTGFSLPTAPPLGPGTPPPPPCPAGARCQASFPDSR